MLIENSIMAGQILSLLEKLNRAVTLEEIQFHLEKPFHFIQLGVERLVREGLAVLDVDRSLVRVQTMPNLSKEIEVKKEEYLYETVSC